MYHLSTQSTQCVNEVFLWSSQSAGRLTSGFPPTAILHCHRPWHQAPTPSDFTLVGLFILMILPSASWPRSTTGQPSPTSTAALGVIVGWLAGKPELRGGTAIGSTQRPAAARQTLATQADGEPAWLRATQQRHGVDGSASGGRAGARARRRARLRSGPAMGRLGRLHCQQPVLPRRRGLRHARQGRAQELRQARVHVASVRRHAQDVDGLQVWDRAERIGSIAGRVLQPAKCIRFCIRNDGFCIKNDGFCNQNDEFLKVDLGLAKFNPLASLWNGPMGAPAAAADGEGKPP